MKRHQAGSNVTSRSKRTAHSPSRLFGGFLEHASIDSEIDDFDIVPSQDDQRTQPTNNTNDTIASFNTRRVDDDNNSIASFRSVIESQEQPFHDFTLRPSQTVGSDPIRSFTDDERSGIISTNNILAGLDEWKPGGEDAWDNSSEKHAAIDNLLEDDFSFINETDSFLNETSDDDHLGAEQEHPAQTPQREPSPQFKMKSTTLPTIYAKSTIQVERDKIAPLSFKPDGMAIKALKEIAQAKEEHAIWESRIRAEMAKQGSVARLCATTGDAVLFRIMDAWLDGVSVFAQCIPVRTEELSCFLQPTRQSQDDHDTIEESFSQPASLPPYIPRPDDKEHTFLFSFAYMQLASASHRKLLTDDCVAIWEPWNTVKAFAAGDQREVHVVTRFMTDSIY